MSKVFVYGTLKYGNPNYHLMQDAANGIAKFVCKAVTVKKYPLVIATSANIPFLLNHEGVGNHVCGEIFEVDCKMKNFLDRVEVVGVFYDIARLDVISEFNEMEVCPVYVLNDFHDHLLKTPMLQSYSGFHVDSFVPRGERVKTLQELIKEVKKV